MATKEKDNCKVVTGEVRFSYAHVFEPASFAGDESNKKYSCAILIPKKDKKTLDKCRAAIEAAMANGKLKSLKDNPLRDGDDERPDDEAYAGMMYVNAKSTRKPQVVDANLDPIMDQDEFYSGCFGRASITFYNYEFGGKKGVAVALNNLQKTKDGERLAGGSSAEEDFSDDDLE